MIDSIKSKLDIIQNKLVEISQSSPIEFKIPIDYMMSLGGKRIRPLLCLLGYELFNDDYFSILNTACALEVFHNFTLVHDDIMDNSPLRRGAPTVYKKWGNATTILVGDVMLIQAYQQILKSKNNPNLLLTRLNEIAIEVCRGQQQDMNFENHTSVTEEEYLEMIRLKTAVLIGFSLEAGGILAKQDKQQCKLLYQLGEKIGIAFQLKDDWLDTYGDTASFGKQIGNDILNNKKTYLLVYALNVGDDSDVKKIGFWLKNTNENSMGKINAVKAIYDKLDVSRQTENLMNKYFKEAFNILDKIECSDNTKEELKSFIQTWIQRKR